MFRWLVPKEASPFHFFDEHAHLILQGAETLNALLTQKLTVEEGTEKLNEIEHLADVLVQSCIEELHQTFITPIDRDQIFELISKMDDCIDAIDAACNQIRIYKIVKIREEAIQFSKILERAAREMVLALSLLKNMKNSDRIRASCTEIRNQEKEADCTFRNALGSLFEESNPTILIIQWKGIFDDLERAADNFQTVANIIEGIILEYV